MNFKKLVTEEWVSALSDLLEGVGEPTAVLDAKMTLLVGAALPNPGQKVPVRLKGRTLGWVHGGARAHAVAGVLSALVEKERQREELLGRIGEREDELAFVKEISANITSTLDASDIAAFMVDEVTKHIESTGASVMLVNEKNGRLEVVAGFGKKFPPEERPVLRAGVGIAGHVILTGEAEIVPDTSRDSRYVPGAYQVCSIICAPILVKGEVIGAMNVSSSRPRNYGEQDLRLVTTLTAVAAPAIHTARSFRASVGMPPELGGLDHPAPAPAPAPARAPASATAPAAAQEPVAVPRHFRETMGVLCVGIRGFSAHERALGLTEVLSFLEEFFGLVRTHAQAHDGNLGPCFGDTALALFPEKEGAIGARALFAALDLSRDIQKWSEARKKAGLLPINVGMGLDLGPVFGGSLCGGNGPGAAYLGDAVTRASRLERLTKAYGIQIAVSDAIRRELGEGFPEIREVDAVQMPGMEKELTILDAFGADPDTRRKAKERNVDDFERALNLYRHRAFTEAAEVLSLVHKKMPFDTPTALLLKRCNNYKKTPPHETWTGVNTLPGR